VAGVVDVHAVGVGQERGDTEVNADHGPVLVDLDVTDALKADAGDGIVRGGVRGYPGFSGLDPPEEGLERPVQAAQRRLLRAERPAAVPFGVEGADVLELRGLLPVLDARLGRVPVGVAAFLQGAVVEAAVIAQHLGKRALLAHGGPHEERVCTDHPAHPLPIRSG
jgi:hypothetical protein